MVAPGFSADCLETLEELDMENRAMFLADGGEQFTYIPCLNDSAAGMRSSSTSCGASWWAGFVASR